MFDSPGQWAWRTGSGGSYGGLVRTPARREDIKLGLGEDQGRATGLLGLAQCEPPVGQLLDLHAGAAVVTAPRLVPAVGAELPLRVGEVGRAGDVGRHLSSFRISVSTASVRVGGGAFALIRSCASTKTVTSSGPST